jgi:hypothetical protein
MKNMDKKQRESKGTLSLISRALAFFFSHMGKGRERERNNEREWEKRMKKRTFLPHLNWKNNSKS